ncbi:MAG: glycoside hydrolase domain-containing protein [Thermoguttaceae bacterium]
MKPPRLPNFLAALSLAACLAAASLPAADWHHPLALDGGDYWRARLPITMANDGDMPLAGDPVVLKIEQGPASVLAGQDARQLRVCDAQGTEWLFALFAPGGQPLREGPIPAGASLVLPAECNAGSAATCYVYFDNPAAGLVPDYLQARPGLVNGSVELGSGDTPDGWQHDEPDPQHRALWSDENPRSGRRCLKTVVAPDAEAAWIATRQGEIHIVAGARYRVEAWVRAEQVEGAAGWYLHIGNAENSMLSAPTLTAGEGSFDWKRVTLDFTAPDGANLLSLGTVLRGTGTAWFDDVSLTCLEPGKWHADLLPVERRELAELGRPADPARWPGEAPDRRAVVSVFNFRPQPQPAAMVSVDMAMIRGRARGRLRPDSIRVTLGDRLVPHTFAGNALLFEGEIPAQTAARYSVYFADDRPAGEEEQIPRVSGSLPNLVANGGFEEGTPLPQGWSPTGPAEGKDGVRFSLDDPGRANLGKACARMDVPNDAPENWRGWHQAVPVRAGGTYLLSAWLKCEGLGGGDLRVHVHLRKADGSLCRTSGMTSLSDGISGTTGWTLTSGLFTMPDDAAQFQIHLTMNAKGTVWHDGVSLAEVAPGHIARFECRPVSPAQGLALWPVPSVVKVFPDDPVPAATEPLQISSAGNEREALQLAFRTGRAIRGAQIRATAPVRGASPQTTLPAPEIHVVGYVPIDYPTSYYQSEAPAWHRLLPTQRPGCDGWPGLWPDPLLPTDRFDLAPDATQAAWLTFAVPKDAPPGDYRGKIRLEANGSTLAERDYAVHVWDFSLPDQNHLAAIYDVRFGPGGQSQWGKPFDQAYPELVQFLAERRLSADRIDPSPQIRYRDGQVEADFTQYDKAAEFYFDRFGLPYSYTPQLFYLFGWAHPPKAVFGEQPYEGEPPYEKADRSKLRPEYKKAYQACLKVFWEHVKEKGWADRMILYISDEPHDWFPHITVQMKALCEMIHEVDPAIPIYSSTWKHVPAWDGSLDVWGIGHYGGVPVDQIARLQKAGDRIWFTTDGQMCTDTPYCGVERLLPHYCFKYGAQAYEFWGASWLTYDPYQYGWHSYIRQSSEPGKYYWVRYPNGDGFLIYPGKGLAGLPQFSAREAAAPLPTLLSSVRLENAREGVEDYEYLYRLAALVRQAKEAGRQTTQAEEALAAAAALVDIPNAGGRYSTRILPDPVALFRTRTRLAEAIEQR